MRDEREESFDNAGPNAPRNAEAYLRGRANGRDVQRPVYSISIMAQMVATHPQTLRMYERMGLVTPQRTRNNIRLYSESDVERVRRIQHLTQELGVNLAGVEVVFKLLAEMQRMQDEAEVRLEEFRAEIERELNRQDAKTRGEE